MKKILDSSATVNSLVYSGGGIESAAALAYAVSKGYNPAFDVTTAKLITGLITERVITSASKLGLEQLYKNE